MPLILPYVTPPPPLPNIVVPTGHWMEVGGVNNFHGLSDWETNVNLIVNADPQGAVVGFIAVFSGNQIEGATQGDYSSISSTINSMLTFLAGLSGPPRKLGIAFNITGNGATANVPAYMLNNPTYGKVLAPFYQGALVSGTSPVNGTDTVHTMRYDNLATMSQVATWNTTLYNEFGSDIALSIPLYSEAQNFSNEVAEMTSAAMTATFANTGGFFDQLRAGAPTQCILHSLSFMNQSDFPVLMAASDRNFLIPMVYDFTNEVNVSGRSFHKLVTTNAVWKGGSYSSLPNGTFVPNYPGLIDRRQLSGGGRGFAAHIGEDELGNSRTPTAVVPPALVGDGALNTAIWPFVQEMEACIVIWYKNAAAGPRCNTTAPITSPPANYADYSTGSPGPNNWGTLLGFIQAVTVPAPGQPPFFA